MKKINYVLVGLLAILVILPACVSKKKYLAAQSASKAQEQNLNAQINSQKTTISELNDSVNSLRGAVSTLGDVYQNTNNQLNLTKEQEAAQRARVKQLEDYLNEQRAALESLRKTVSDALTGFNSSELTVTMNNGRVYVSMQESLLFPSGSAVVNKRGKDALAKLANVLNQNPEIYINIEGHTDNVPIHTAKYKDNWDLSTARAVSIAHVLIDDYSVSPANLTASGRSYYHPVASNSDAAGRAQNRRTEIILLPKLDELMKIMNAPVPAPASGGK